MIGRGRLFFPDSTPFSFSCCCLGSMSLVIRLGVASDFISVGLAIHPSGGSYFNFSVSKMGQNGLSMSFSIHPLVRCALFFVGQPIRLLIRSYSLFLRFFPLLAFVH